MKRLLSGLLLCVLPLTAGADTIAKLKTFISFTHSGQAKFTQDVLDKNGRNIQSASGVMQFVRPGKFRWEYRKPYEQLIVGDGEKFWLYDEDLNQVTEKRLDAALGSSPAALLAGDNEIERSFDLKDAGSRGGLEWLEAKPKAKDTSFDSIRMGFDAQSELVVVELFDAFSHRTVLRFSDMKHNPQIPPGRFKFVPPEGADVLAE